MTDMHPNDLVVMRASANRIIEVARDMIGETKRLREGVKLRDISVEAATIFTLCENAIKRAGGDTEAQ